jgi:hypothetical protein
LGPCAFKSAKESGGAYGGLDAARSCYATKLYAT